MNSSEIRVIVDHAVKAEESLRVATKVWTAFESIRTAVVEKYSERTAVALGGLLPQWKVNVSSSSIDDHLGDLVWIQKEEWRGKYWIAATWWNTKCFDNPKKSKGIYLCYRINKVRGGHDQNRIKSLLDKEFGLGEESDRSMWRRTKVLGLEEILAFMWSAKSAEESASDLAQIAGLIEGEVNTILRNAQTLSSKAPPE